MNIFRQKTNYFQIMEEICKKMTQKITIYLHFIFFLALFIIRIIHGVKKEMPVRQNLPVISKKANIDPFIEKIMAQFNFIETGQIDYRVCWDHQEELLAKIVSGKHQKGKPSAENYFLLVEHPPVYTLGKSGDQNNMLISPDFLQQIGATFYRINRGGDITYHGPGQLVGYPIIDLEFYQLGVKEYIEKMEEALIQTIADFGLTGSRKEGATGVWLNTSDPDRARKICAIGVRVSRSVTMHGFALNVNTDLRYFNYINPCGFASSAVTSLQQELGRPVEMENLKTILKEKFNLIY
jgi:lipoyl(octanoyl) transferase